MENTQNQSVSRTARILKGLFLYALVPALGLWLLANPIGTAVRGSAPAAFLILLAAFALVGANWLAYTALRRRRPSLLVFAWGMFILLVTALVESEALPASAALVSTLAVICGCLALAFLFLLSFWLAARRSKPAHVFAVGCWITVGVIAFFMAYRVFRDIEIRRVTGDTWITAAILIALIPAAFSRRILAAARRSAFHRRTAGLAEGKILQLIGETRLDLDEDPVTDYHARIEYTVDGVSYETRADIYKITMRLLGKEVLVGKKIPVHYDPADPARAYADRIGRHFLDHQDPGPETEAEKESSAGP